MLDKKLKKITVYGLISTIEFQKVKCCAEDLHKKRPDIFGPPSVHDMLEFEWSVWLNNKKLELKGETWEFNDAAMTFLDDQLIGDYKAFLKWSIDNFNFEDCRNPTLYETLRKEAYANYLVKTKNTYVYLEFTYENKKLGRIVIELFKNILPKTCENFRLLCTGEKGRSSETATKLHYKGSVLHRIVSQGWIQGGDIISGKGTGSESTYGGLFEDESFAIIHNKRGVVGMCNTGRNTNGSQFYITLQPMPFLDKKCVAFGQVVEGSETLNKLEAINCQNQRPLKEVVIDDCGVYKFEF